MHGDELILRTEQYYTLTSPIPTEVQVEVTLRLTISLSACLVVGHPFGAHDQILLFPSFCRKIALLFVLGRPV
jgi:hypothetical protein